MRAAPKRHATAVHAVVKQNYSACFCSTTKSQLIYQSYNLGFGKVHRTIRLTSPEVTNLIPQEAL
jgi:hypothetical protein